MLHPEKSVLTANYATEARFPELVGRLVRSEPALEGVEYTAEYPSEEAVVPAIRWAIHRLTPGIEDVERLKARHRSFARNEDGTLTEYLGQFQTVLYQWDCCARSNAEAEALASRFNRLMHAWVPVLKAAGVRDLFFEERLRDALLPQTKDLHSRSVRWRVHLTELRPRVLPSVEEIRIRLFGPRREGWEAVTRGNDPTDSARDILSQRYVEEILHVSDASPSGIARTDDYARDLDYVVVQNRATDQTALTWLRAGKAPEAGATYFVRYTYHDDWRLIPLP